MIDSGEEVTKSAYQAPPGEQNRCTDENDQEHSQEGGSEDASNRYRRRLDGLDCDRPKTVTSIVVGPLCDAREFARDQVESAQVADFASGKRVEGSFDAPQLIDVVETDVPYRGRRRTRKRCDSTLGGGPGRAIDLALKIGYDINDRWSVTAGYRTVEGGADVDEVDNFAWFNSAMVSGVVRF
jgi:hypothetical protein